MNPARKTASIISALVFLCCATAMSEAQAFRGRGAAFAVGAAAGSANNYPPPQQQAAPAQQPVPQQPMPAQQAAPAQQAVAAQLPATQPPAGSDSGVPLGSVVATLPAGCTQTAQGGVAYYNCGGTFYQAVFEGSNLKYVTTSPK